MKNLRFDHLEQQLPEDDWLAGEVLYAGGALTSLRETEKRFWVGIVKDGDEAYETEAHITPTRIKTAACECEQYRATGHCGHLVAMALGLRARLADQAANKDAQPPLSPKLRPARTGANRLKISLAEADPEALHRFLLDYARRQPAFGLALRAFLSDNPAQINYHDQSRDLLEAALRDARQSNGRIGLRGAQQVARLLDEMMIYSRRQFELGAWIEAATPAQLIIDRLPPVLRKVDRGNEAWISSLLKAAQIIDDILASSLAPALRDAIMAWLQGQLLKMTLRAWSLDLPLWAAWLRYNPQNELNEALGRQMIQSYLAEGRSPAPIFDAWRQAKGHAFIIWLVAQGTVAPGWRWPALAWLVAQELWPEAGALAAGEGPHDLPAPDPAIEAYLLPALWHSGKNQLLQFYLYQAICQKLDSRYYQLLRQYNLLDPNPLLAALNALPFSGRKIDLMALTLADAQRWTEVLDLAGRYPQARLLENYAAELFSAAPQRFEEMAEAWLIHYLNNHVGRKSAQLVSQLLSRWQAAGAHALVARMAQYIHNNFPERHSLHEELATLAL
jgi:hypothetical protein